MPITIGTASSSSISHHTDDSVAAAVDVEARQQHATQ